MLHEADNNGIETDLATFRGPFRRVLQRTELLEQLDPERIHNDVATAVAAADRLSADDSDVQQSASGSRTRRHPNAGDA